MENCGGSENSYCFCLPSRHKLALQATDAEAKDRAKQAGPLPSFGGFSVVEVHEAARKAAAANAVEFPAQHAQLGTPETVHCLFLSPLSVEPQAIPAPAALSISRNVLLTVEMNAMCCWPSLCYCFKPRMQLVTQTASCCGLMIHLQAASCWPLNYMWANKPGHVCPGSGSIAE